MSYHQFPVYREDDSIYISSFGLELDGMKARWGAGRRHLGIIHYVLSGRGFFNGHPVTADQGFYIEPHSICEYMPDPEDPWNYFWMDCSEDFARRYVRSSARPDENGVFTYDFRVKLLPVIEKIMQYGHTMSSVESLSYGFSILKLHTAGEESGRTVHYVRQAKNYIENSLGRKLTVQDVANAVSVNDRYLYSLFVRYEGISLKEYILKRKIETAIDLLENTDIPISEVSSAAGFADLYSFSRLFKIKQGLSPSQYRKSLKKQPFVSDE